MDFAFNAIGLIGVALILLAYFLLQRGTLTARRMAYLLQNLLGASLILVSLVHDWNLAAFVIEASDPFAGSYGSGAQHRAAQPRSGWDQDPGGRHHPG